MSAPAGDPHDHRVPALLLVDVLRGLLTPGGRDWYPSAVEVVVPLGRLLAAARQGGRLVVHVTERHRPGVDDFEHRRLGPHYLAGTPDAEILPGFEPTGPRELVVPKRRYSGFFATDLDLLLREQGAGLLVVAGVKTNVCVRATVQDAFAHGYDVVVPTEATNSNRPHLATASLEDVARYFGRVVPLTDAEALLRAS